MTLYEFSRLELNERMEAVNQCATFLDHFITKDIRINCYTIDTYFAQILHAAVHRLLPYSKTLLLEQKSTLLLFNYIWLIVQTIFPYHQSLKINSVLQCLVNKDSKLT